MKDNLRDAAQAALETLEDVFGKDKIDVGAINNLRAALAEPVVKESLTTQPSNTPRTDAHCKQIQDDAIGLEYVATELQYWAENLERELAAAQADAKRYRWLRDDKRGRSLSVSSLEWTGNAKLSDAAVDAAMRIRWL
jgi:hypothetical protein